MSDFDPTNQRIAEPIQLPEERHKLAFEHVIGRKHGPRLAVAGDLHGADDPHLVVEDRLTAANAQAFQSAEMDVMQQFDEPLTRCTQV